jgi:hypothetical protein
MDNLFDYIKPEVERIARKQFNNKQTPQLIGVKKRIKDAASKNKAQTLQDFKT